jgi:hypothetical protein
MPQKHYSPEIRRFLVTVLYHEARGRGVPMTVLTNQLLETALAGSQGWKQAEQAMQLQEQPPPYSK